MVRQMQALERRSHGESNGEDDEFPSPTGATMKECRVSMVWCLTLVAFLTHLNVAAAEEKFPSELCQFVPVADKPVFEARGVGHWDTAIRERGWIIKDGDHYKMWYTGYDGTRTGIRLMGFASSKDGVHWKRNAKPLIADRWIEDMMVVKRGKTYYMFAEGRKDVAQLLTSTDGIRWKQVGPLDVRYTNGKPLTPGPYGTPTAWYEDGTWYLFYERRDAGVWLATSKDMRVWTHVQDEPVLRPGPGQADGLMIALNQIVKRKGRYYAYYHGTGTKTKPRLWCTCLATSKDLIHWEKFPGNPLLPAKQNKSSGILVEDGSSFRFYTMHARVDLHAPKKAMR